MNFQITPQRVALICLILAVGLDCYLFAESRNDPALRIAALVSGTNLVAALAAIASTMLTGKDLTHPEPAPPGTTSTSTVQVTQTTPPTPPATPIPGQK